jgi:K+-transporting ATPase c subunit
VCRREIHRHHTTTGHCAVTCNRQSDHPYTQASSGSSNVPETDRSIEEKVMARKKDKNAQKDKKAQKTQSAQGAPTTAATSVAPSASPRPKKS